jgi:predicted small lipoprotein YifL
VARAKVKSCAAARQYLYFCTGKSTKTASKVSTEHLRTHFDALVACGTRAPKRFATVVPSNCVAAQQKESKKNRKKNSRTKKITHT